MVGGMAVERKDASFMNGVPELLILRLLGRREMYGYELVRAIEEGTGGVIGLGGGGVYALLHWMERRGQLKSRRMEKDGRSRLYYRLTAAGRARSEETTGQWRRISAAIETAIGGGDAIAKPA